jgi:integrase
LKPDLQFAPGREVSELGGSLAQRRYQGGSLRKVKTGGDWKWEARWREDEIVDGQTKRVCRKQIIGSVDEYPSEKLAKRALMEILAPINSTTYRPRLVATFKEVADRWQKLIMVTHKRSAQGSEKSHLKVHLIPKFGAMKMKDIEADPELVQAWVSGLEVEPKTQKNIVTTARLIFDDAREWRYVTYNPFEKLRLKQQGLKQEEFALSFEQVMKILNASVEPYRTMYWLCWETGIRAGELLGLPTANVDLDHRIVKVRQKIWRGQVETVKSRKSVRDVEISNALTEHLKEFTDGRTGLTFVDSEGKAITYDHALAEELQPLLAKIGIPKCGFHAFRHGNATMMDQQNVPMATRMDRLGHEKPQTTMGYTHSGPARDFVETVGDRIATEMIQ